jgi:DNA-binding NarL/FixJ family response regulator
MPDPGDGTVLVGWSMGVDGKRRPDRRFSTAERDAEILRRRSEGESIRGIAAGVGCSVGTVHRVVRASS